MRRLLSQERAAYALKRVKEASKDHDYAGLCRDMPAMLLQNGLGQSLAFLLSKSKGANDKAHRQLYDDLSGWLIQNRRIYSEGGLIEAVMNGDRRTYMTAHEEALELSGWLKRFADALIGKEDKQ